MPNPRAIALRCLDEWSGGTRFADEILHHLVGRASPDPRDRALATELFYGILRQLRLLDFLIARYRADLPDAGARDALRLGLYQILFTRIPEHAAVNETVALSGHARPLVNAILRRALRERDTLRAEIESQPLALRLSHPDLLVERWSRAHAPEDVERLCLWNNQPAPLHARVNRLRVSPEQLLASGTEFGAATTPLHPDILTLERLPQPWIDQGLCYLQDAGTLMPVELLEPAPGETILDACAAPGGKTFHIAQIMGDSGRIIAADSRPERLERLIENAKRLGVSRVETIRHAWGQDPIPESTPPRFDRILVDAPCTNTGALRRRVDARWRIRQEDFPRMAEFQRAILAAVLPLLKPGGTLVYSTCSIEPEENAEISRWLAETFPQLEPGPERALLPHRDGTDGIYAARFTLEKRPAKMRAGGPSAKNRESIANRQ